MEKKRAVGLECLMAAVKAMKTVDVKVQNSAALLADCSAVS